MKEPHFHAKDSNDLAPVFYLENQDEMEWNLKKILRLKKLSAYFISYTVLINNPKDNCMVVCMKKLPWKISPKNVEFLQK